jgi:uncharacterized membrane protein YcaP (DUF421 family)
MGKKKLQHYTVFDFIFIVLLSGLLEESIYHIETPWYYFLIGVFVWCLVNFIITKLEMRFESLRPVIKGQSVFLIKHGEIIHSALKENDLEMEQLRHALRSKGVFSLSEVNFAVLETNGEINVMKTDSNYKEFPVMVIEEGRIVPEEVSGVTEERIRELLEGYQMESIENIFYAELIGDTLYLILKGGGDNGAVNNETN